eukprot:182994_1
MGASIGARHEDKTENDRNAKFTSNKARSTRKRLVKFKLHIAIDFGTNGCALAIAHGNKVFIYDKWRGTNRSRTVKTKTHILLNEQKEVMNFGNNAKFLYSELEDKERKTKLFFERFKMALYEDKIKSTARANDDTKQNEVDTKQYIEASNGTSVLASIVFVQAFRHLQDKAKKFLFKVTKEKINDDEIQFILTVPAIWSEAAKNKMRRWISEAGLVDDNIIDQCIVVYEPDCASLALQKEYFEHIYDKDGNTMLPHPTLIEDPIDSDDGSEHGEGFEEGDKYILVDAGGGTVDIACHQIMRDGSVEEIIRPTGGKWGSCYVDDLYIMLLNDIFGKDMMDLYRKEEPSQFVKIGDYFQLAKKTFSENQQCKTHRVQLPYEFLCYLEEQFEKMDRVVEDTVHEYSKTLQYFHVLFKDEDDISVVSSTSDGHMCDVKLISSNPNAQFEDSDEYLELDCVIWKCMFESKIGKIVDHIHKLLKKPSLKNCCNYLCFVGGFASSKYLQERMREEFGSNTPYNLRLIIPKKPILSVVEGAAYFGIRKNFIKARKLRYSYGMIVYLTKGDARKRGISDEYIEKYTTNDGAEMVKNCFHVIAHKDERVAFNEVKTVEARRVPGKTKAFIQILCSDLQYPKVVSDGRLLGSIEVPCHDDDIVMTEFHFYGTMFKVYSYLKNKKIRKKEVAITYAL